MTSTPTGRLSVGVARKVLLALSTNAWHYLDDSNFYTLPCRLLSEEARRAGGLLHIATHDPRLADR
jgi:hypothetical protein